MTKIKHLKMNNELKKKELLIEAEELRSELNKLISLNAGFSEIYCISTRLDKVIVKLYRNEIE